ncbi:phage tail tube protein [Kineosporia succinea]|uniref:Phage tail protein n=1 Tax=Kineosporia succinea TaxID=84632 RepID=A0ABT9NXS6_9ACTN|nr:hypothetical protein [Kineosporia succinea]MDP9825228.1 hypothetical protein [Kineosporia succinea]
MAKNSDNVRVGYAGSVYVGLVGATAPVNPTAAWDPADWTELGHISEDGITEQSSRDTAEFKAWGFPNSPVRIQTTSQEFSFQVTFLETSHHILSLFHGIDLDDFTSTASAGGVPQFLKANKGSETGPQERALGIDVIDGTHLQRIIVPKAQITETGDLSYKTDEMVQYQVTFKGLVGSDGVSWTKMWTNLSLAA